MATTSMAGTSLGCSSFVTRTGWQSQFYISTSPNQTLRNLRSCKTVIVSAASEDGDKFKVLVQKMAKQPRVSFGEEFMRLVAGASSAPIAQYIASPSTPLHTLDPRVKQAWLMALVFLPSRSHISFRIGLVVFLSAITTCFLPKRTWQDQLGRMALLSGLLFLSISLATDGVPPLVQDRTPPPSLSHIPALPSSFGGYKYVLWKLGPFQLTRKGLSVGTTAASLSFTVLQSASLCLSTTMPEHLAAGLRWYLTPLARFKLPVDELVLTLLLSLRFVGIVFDEIRNIALGIVARGVMWKQLSLLETADVFFMFLGRIFKNLFNHAEQIAQAMIARGYRGNPATHKIYCLADLSMKNQDYLAIAALLAFVAIGIFSDAVLC